MSCAFVFGTECPSDEPATGEMPRVSFFPRHGPFGAIELTQKTG